jgi:hypothetical protein
MARRSQALLAAVAGGCLILCACGSAATPGAAGSAAASPTAATRTAPLIVTGHFCADLDAFMRNVPATPPTRQTSEAVARENLRKLLRSTVRGFTALKAEGPAKLHRPLRKIIGVYKADERALTTSRSLAQISEGMVREDSAGTAAFQRLLEYISVSCG